MSNAELEALRRRAQAAHDVDADLLQAAANVLRGVFPGAPLEVAPSADPTVAALHLVDLSLPGWTISLRGTATEPDGHWHCSLRESGAHDNDEVIGADEAPTVGLALLRALLAVARFESAA